MHVAGHPRGLQRANHAGKIGDLPEQRDSPERYGIIFDESMSSASPPQIGSVLGTYRLEQVLGEGGMGIVYRAEHMKLGRQVAIKLLKPEFASNPMAVRRFFDEARVVNRFNHEHIVQIEDFIDAEGSEKYYVMELLKGQSLTELQAALGAVPLSRAVAIMAQVAETLAAVHEQEVVHRDLKPDNVFLIQRSSTTDFVKLLDFGVAKLSSGPEGRSAGSTAAGTLLGTPEYMAPEQLAGKAVDARADIYSFGIIMFELCAGGHRPFVAKSFGEMVIQHMTVPPPDPNEHSRVGALPPALAELILHCLEKEPNKRPASMREVHGRLLALAGEIKDGKPSRARMRRPLKWGIAATLAMAALAVATWQLLPRFMPHAPTAAAAAPVASGPVAAAPAVEPPPATPTPAPQVPPQAVAQVEASFESFPKGARVVRMDTDEILGITPFTLKLPRSERLLVVEVRKDGFQREALNVQLEKSDTWRVTLKKRSKRGSDKGGPIDDPYAPPR